MTPRSTLSYISPAFAARRRKARLVKLVGLLALAGLLAIASLPPHQGQHADAGELSRATGNGGATWHG